LHGPVGPTKALGRDQHATGSIHIDLARHLLKDTVHIVVAAVCKSQLSQCCPETKELWPDDFLSAGAKTRLVSMDPAEPL
jgi:hypothetical protein